jgi:4-hydroxy-tetrahydrodipicolinate synthase
MLGADALLIVTPYYNRSSRQGLVEHYLAIADKVEIPIIMYNVPSRTGMNLEPRVIAELAKHPMLCAVKDANSDPGHMMELARLCGDGIAIYSGNDDCILPAMALGARGVISVAANIIPNEIHSMAMSWIRGDVKACRDAQLEWLPLIRQLFSEVNPIPVKAALSMMGRIEDTLRLPLVPLSPTPREALRQEMKRCGLID